MDYKLIRKFLLKCFIGFLGFTALVAIISVLIDEFDELQLKILLTSFTISVASIFSMACAAFIEKKNFIKLGVTGILLSIAATLLITIAIWLEIEDSEYWKLTGTFMVLSIAFAHTFLLLLPELGERQQRIKTVNTVSIAVLTLQIVIAIWGEIDEELYYRFIAVVAIIVALETLLVPLLMKIRAGSITQTKEKLVLEKIEGDLYQDTTGKKYRLLEIPMEEDGEVHS